MDPCDPLKSPLTAIDPHGAYHLPNLARLTKSRGVVSYDLPNLSAFSPLLSGKASPTSRDSLRSEALSLSHEF